MFDQNAEIENSIEIIKKPLKTLSVLYCYQNFQKYFIMHEILEIEKMELQSLNSGKFKNNYCIILKKKID